MDKRRATSAKPKTKSSKSVSEKYEPKCYCKISTFLDSSDEETNIKKEISHPSKQKARLNLKTRPKTSINESTYLCYEPSVRLGKKKPSSVDNMAISNYNNVLQPNKFTDLLHSENKFTTKNKYYISKLNPNYDRREYINKFKTHKDSSSDEEYIEKIKEFRKQNYEDCYSGSTLTQFKPPNRDVINVMKQMDVKNCKKQSNHNCKHHFVLNDRLFPIPINSNEHGVSICSECQRPLRNTNKIPLQTSETNHLEQKSLQNSAEDSKSITKKSKVINKPATATSSKSTSFQVQVAKPNSASCTSGRECRCNLVGHKYIIPRHDTKIVQPNSLALRFQQ